LPEPGRARPIDGPQATYCGNKHNKDPQYQRRWPSHAPALAAL